MTKKELFALIAETMNDNAEVVEMCEKEIERLSRPRKKYPKKVSEEDQELRAAVLTELAEGAATVKELAEKFGVSSPKMTGTLRALKDAVVRTPGETPKAPSTYSLA